MGEMNGCFSRIIIETCLCVCVWASSGKSGRQGQVVAGRRIYLWVLIYNKQTNKPNQVLKRKKKHENKETERDNSQTRRRRDKESLVIDRKQLIINGGWTKHIVGDEKLTQKQRHNRAETVIKTNNRWLSWTTWTATATTTYSLFHTSLIKCSSCRLIGLFKINSLMIFNDTTGATKS